MTRPARSLGALLGLACFLAATPGPAPADLLTEARTRDVAAHPACSECGMDRATFASSRHLVRYPDGSEVGTCSIRCAAVVLVANLGRGPAEVLAADQGGADSPEPLLPVARLVYLIDPDRPGTMSPVAKEAYSSKALAARNRGPRGRIVGFREAFEAALLELARGIRLAGEGRGRAP